MIQFKTLRLQGFKSFVEKTELDIGSGLNGIVGPNGCGKSNLVEALRWVMGEGSARRMRGDGMEDVIFAGTSNRPSRNIAEVSLLMDNSQRTAPAAYNNGDEIEITRRIERDHGSVYKINGKSVRARDIQMLLADTLTGANSPALVSQGRVTQMIAAKPMERRLILEDSAGISGLYARRHEAELRLKAADTNLQRVQDVTGSMEGRLGALKRQARQAERYRNISAQIRQYEILVAYLEWLALEEKRKTHEEAFAKAESIVAEKLAAVTQLTKTQLTQSQELPALRQSEAECAATLQTRKIALMRLEEEEARIAAQITETQNQLAQTVKDLGYETQSLEDNSQTLERILEEQKSLLTLQSGEEDKLGKLEDGKSKLEEKVLKLESDYEALMEQAAEQRARKKSLESEIAQGEARLQTLGARKQQAEEDKNILKSSSTAAQEEEALRNSLTGFEKQQDDLAKERGTCADSITQLESELKISRQNKEEARQALAAFQAELAMLEKFIAGAESGDYEPILKGIEAHEGFEKALSRALGDSLMASLDETAPSFWKKRNLKTLPALPEGLSPLQPWVKADEFLKPALSQIGVVETPEEAARYHEILQPGQAIVSVAGDYWRWDGYCVRAAAQDKNALHLEQKNRLETMKLKREDMENAASSAIETLEKLDASLTEKKKRLEEIARLQAEVAKNLQKSSADLAKLREETIRRDEQLKRLTDVITECQTEIGGLSESLSTAKSQLKELEDDPGKTDAAQSDVLRQDLAEAREAYQEAVRSFERMMQEKNSRKARLQAIGDERVSLQNRTIRSREQIKGLDLRKTDLQEKLAALQSRPRNFEDARQELLDAIAVLEKERSEAAERLAVVENEVAETNKALKEAERILGEAREARAHALAMLGSLKEQNETVTLGIAEKFEMRPQDLKEHIAGNLEQIETDSLPKAREQREKLNREREAIGPVNLRAEQEAQELEQELSGLLQERDDLVQAIEELRGGIQTINKEARERLLNAFEHINTHFKTLFTRLFQGGQASLSLIDSGDPLDAGLEIFAQPPGKSLQSLSLLSGGEQTMTSIALIFAMFLTNPAPICVLDEIDAPLDDANVDRVCDLLEDIAEQGQTRFLIITHHRLTMARMDRLYGVTMAEKGVSQLVSVDLQQSFEFAEAA